MINNPGTTTVKHILTPILLALLLLPQDGSARTYVTNLLYADQDSQYLYSDGYLSGQNYARDQTTYWVIKARRYNERVVAEVVDSVLEQSSGCSKDYLEFYEDRLSSKNTFGRYCGNSLPSVTSEEEPLVIVFVSDSDITHKGFKIKYYSEQDPLTEVLEAIGISLGVIIAVFCLMFLYCLCTSQKHHKKCCKKCCKRKPTSVEQLRRRSFRRERSPLQDDRVEVWTATIAMRRLNPHTTPDRTVSHPPPAVPIRPPPYTTRDFALSSYVQVEEIDPAQPPSSPPPAYVDATELQECNNHPNYISNHI